MGVLQALSKPTTSAFRPPAGIPGTLLARAWVRSDTQMPHPLENLDVT